MKQYRLLTSILYPLSSILYPLSSIFSPLSSILFLVLPFLAFSEIIFGRQTLYRTDISWIHYPGHIFMAEEWLAGRVPLWDPYRHSGVPMLAEPQIGVLYPLRLLFLSPLSPSFELSLFILLHFTLASLFTFSLARSLRLGAAAATVAGLAFGLGGFLMAQVSNLNIMTGAVWLPLILAGVIQAVQRRTGLAALLAGLPLALQILTAHSQIVFYSLVTITGYGVYRLSAELFFGPASIKGNIRPTGQTGLLLVAALASGLLLAAPQLLPTFELVQLSVRSSERGLALLTENSLHPLMWLNLLLPSAFGNNVVGFRVGDPFQEVFIYVGFMPLLLALFSLFGRRASLDPWQRSHLAFFGWLLIAASLLAMGSHTPLLYEYVIQYLPGFDLFRIPSRWLMLVNLALAILAGFGLDMLLKEGLSRRSGWLFLGTGLFLSAGMISLWLGHTTLLAWSDSFPEPYRKLATVFFQKSFEINPIYQQRLWLRWLAGLTVPAGLLLANMAVTAILLRLWTTRRISAGVFAWLVTLAVSLDLVVAGGVTINPVKPASRWQGLAGGTQYILAHAGDGRVFPLGVSGEEAAISHLGQYFPSVYHVYSASGYASPLKLARYDTFLHETDPVQALQVLGVRYLLTRGQMGADVASTYPLVYQDEESLVYENKQALPRAFVVHQAIQVASPAEALAYFQVRRTDPGQTVILEAETRLPPLPAANATPRSPATIVRQHPQLVEVEARLAEAGYLVLLDTFYPGWVATVDGQPAPIYRANYINRAVFVPAGEHVIRFEYRPGSFRLGLGLALFALVSLTGVGVVSLYPGKQRP